MTLHHQSGLCPLWHTYKSVAFGLSDWRSSSEKNRACTRRSYMKRCQKSVDSYKQDHSWMLLDPNKLPEETKQEMLRRDWEQMPIARLNAKKTNWYRLYSGITRHWKELKGSQTRERIWADVNEIVRSIKRYHESGELFGPLYTHSGARLSEVERVEGHSSEHMPPPVGFHCAIGSKKRLERERTPTSFVSRVLEISYLRKFSNTSLYRTAGLHYRFSCHPRYHVLEARSFLIKPPFLRHLLLT